MKSRKEIIQLLRDNKKEIDDHFIQISYWNQSVRLPGEAAVDPDPTGELAVCQKAYADFLKKDEALGENAGPRMDFQMPSIFWHVYDINDVDTWFAPTERFAIIDFLRTTSGVDVAVDISESDLEVLKKEHEIFDVKRLEPSQLESRKFWDADVDRHAMANWVCECGHVADANCRWNGSAFEHHHGYPIGYVLMRNIHCRTFAEELARRIAAGPRIEQFATTDS